MSEKPRGGEPEGEVSEVANLRGQPTPIQPEDAVAGYPEPGKPDVGETGPDAIPVDNILSAEGGRLVERPRRRKSAWRPERLPPWLTRQRRRAVGLLRRSRPDGGGRGDHRA
ncbi:hypothetical protein [Nocardioides aquiterrae]|uniref:Uncharacterized protein n=1 Tax=Nocardioides aquiterrae TaxID=203799 RepID=A0ABN1UT10_9ACTN